MIPFPYQLNIKGRNIQGKLYSHTGIYIGGKQTKPNSKNASEKIAVRDDTGRVRTALLNYIIDPPEKCTVTLFYFRHGSHLRLFKIYIHETDSFHVVSADILDDMIAAALRFGILRRVWSDMLSYVIWFLIAVSALFALCAGYYLGDDGLVTIVSAALSSCFLLIIRGPLMNRLGGTRRMTATMNEQLVPLCRSLISALAKQKKRRRPAATYRLI